jgi:hypothetical protein
MLPLATPWVPSLNPFGGTSVIAMLVVATLVAWTGADVGERTRRFLTALAPFLLIGLCAMVSGSPVSSLLGERIGAAGASEFLAGYIYLGFAFGFGFVCFKYLTAPYRLIGWLSTLFCGSLLTYEFASNLLGAFTAGHGRFGYRSMEPFSLAAIGLCWLTWVPLLVIMERRARERLRRRTNCCVECGYDLTGNVSGVCPECGSLVPQGAVSDQRSAVSLHAPGRSADVADPLSDEHAVE